MKRPNRRRFEPSPKRNERNRAAALLAVFLLFLAGYLFVITRPGLLAEIDSTVISALSGLVSIGIGVLVTTFSFVFVALSLVSAQFSPRIVRHFWHADRFRFFFLWSSVLVLAYCFVIQFTPYPRLHLLGLVLGGYQTFVLFPVFLGYLADNINAASITKNIADRTVDEVARAYELKPGAYEAHRERGVVRSTKSGFLENIDSLRLAAVFAEIRARDPEARLIISNYVGSFIEIASPLAHIEPPVAINENLEANIAACFSVHKFRSYTNDIEYGIRQLVDIAIKAISPAINDPTTCVNCIHQLGVILKEIAVREDHSTLYNQMCEAGVFLKEPSFEQYLDDAYDQIYQWGRRDHVVVRNIVSVLNDILSAVPDVGRVATVVKEVDEMELGWLIDGKGDDRFGLREYRNYARKSLAAFYTAAGERSAELGEMSLSSRSKQTAKRYEESIEVF